MKVSVEKPGSPSEILEHHGTKGMKWGVRRKSAKAVGRKAGTAAAKEASRSGVGRVEAKRTGRKVGGAAAKADYKSTKTGMGLTKSSREFAGKFPTSRQRTMEIHRARIQTRQKEHQILGETNPAKRQKMYASYLKNPDRATALRMTRGEKAVAAVIAVGLPGPGTGAVIGYTGTTVAIRKSIEGAQRRRARK